MQQTISSLFDLTGRVALCTGGTSGIGRRMAWALSQAGADVVLIGRNKEALAEATTQLESGCGGRGCGNPCRPVGQAITGGFSGESQRIFVGHLIS